MAARATATVAATTSAAEGGGSAAERDVVDAARGGYGLDCGDSGGTLSGERIGSGTDSNS